MLPGVDLASLWGALEAAAEQSSIAIYVARIDTDPPAILYASQLAAEILGRPRESLIDMTPWEILIPEDQVRIQQMIALPSADLPPSSVDLTVERPDGTRIPIRLGRTRLVTAGQVLSFGYFRDVSPERDAVEALRRSEARFRFLVEAAPDGVVIVSRGQIVFINRRGAELIANATIDEVMGRPIGAFLPPDDAAAAAERIGRMFATGTEMPPNEYGVLVDPERVVEIKSIICDWEGTPAVLAFARDVTERKRLQHKLVEHDRLAALGTLSAGVAHEINNPLTYATLGLQRIERTLMGADLPPATLAQVRVQIREIEHGISRVASITRGLRTFARPDDGPPGPVSLTEVVERSLRMVENDLRHRAQLVRTILDVPPVTGNASRLEQVVVNLLLNAIQSLRPERPQNEIELVLLQRGANVVLTIRDTGRGIPALLRDRIFEPFFTTRAVGEGMGLGLSVCRTIVEGFGGTIEVASTEGQGTTMTVALPIHRGSHPSIAPPAAPTSTSRKRVLIIDDEPLLRDALTRLLGADHEITTASSGAEGLAAIARGPFDVIVCDVMMPGMNGQEVHRRIACDHPGLERRIVFITGGTFSPELDEFLANTPNPLLAKPFQLDDVIAAVESVAST
ncbi:MAG: ATP-binding protein [Kofleriaceae bacterium]